MRKLKLILICLLDVLIVALGALLPMITSTLLDQASVNQMQYGSVSSVELAFAEVEPALTLLEKLNILKYAGPVPLSVNETQMGEEEAKATFWAQLQPYLDTDLIPNSMVNLEKVDFLLYSQVFYHREDPRQYMTVWIAELSSMTDPYQSLSAILDDETGKLLSITYTTYDENYHADWRGWEERLYLLADVYFAGLGIQPENEEDWFYGKASTELLYNFTVPVYDMLIISFDMYDEGFYMQFM